VHCRTCCGGAESATGVQQLDVAPPAATRRDSTSEAELAVTEKKRARSNIAQVLLEKQRLL